MDLVQFHLELINGKLAKYEPWQVAAGSIAAYVVAAKLFEIATDYEPLPTRVKRAVFSLVRRIPYVKDKIDRELGTALKGLEKSMVKSCPGKTPFTELPAVGLTGDQIIAQLTELVEFSKIDQHVREFKVCRCQESRDFLLLT